MLHCARHAPELRLARAGPARRDGAPRVVPPARGGPPVPQGARDRPIISLTVAPLDRNECERFGFELFHIPIRDGEAPEISEIERFLSYVAYGLGGAKKVVAHCGAGYGRTGTMLACFLVRAGRRAEEAIAEVRRRIPGAVENEAQERRVEEYALHLERKGRTTAREGA